MALGKQRKIKKRNARNGICFHLQLKQMILVGYNWLSDSYPVAIYVCLSAERTFGKVKTRWVSWEGTKEKYRWK